MDVYDLAEWCALAELGAISMDNGCAAVAFPDFTRGHWNDVKGFHHAFATPKMKSLPNWSLKLLPFHQSTGYEGMVGKIKES